MLNHIPRPSFAAWFTALFIAAALWWTFATGFTSATLQPAQTQPVPTSEVFSTGNCKTCDVQQRRIQATTQAGE